MESVGEEDKDLSYVSQEIVNHRMNTIPQAYEKLESWVKQSVVFGTSLLNVVWRFQKDEVAPGQATVSKDEPDFQVTNILDCFYNPIIPDVENQNSIITRSVLSIKEAKSNPHITLRINSEYLTEKRSNRKETPTLTPTTLQGRCKMTELTSKRLLQTLSKCMSGLPLIACRP